MSRPGQGGALERAIGRAGSRRVDVERCDLCSEAVPPQHRHVLDTDRGEALCACQACTLLFAQAAASRGHYRLVPQRRLRLPELSTAALGVPVGLAFFVPRPDGGVLAHYPSPMGATQWEVDPDTWRALVATCPELDGIEPEVEALLVNTARGARQCWLVPIDDCFRLVAVVRREWTGLSGGSRVWPEVERFFDRLGTAVTTAR